jgi:hypothetical protein
MQQQVATVEGEEQVFPAPLSAMDVLAGQQVRQLRGHRPAQRRLAYPQGGYAASFQMWQDAAQGGFDFRKLRQGAGLASAQ